jgi:hypothetical protein
MGVEPPKGEVGLPPNSRHYALPIEIGCSSVTLLPSPRGGEWEMTNGFP